MDGIVDELLREQGIIVKSTDGLLLVVVDDQGRVHPHVLRLGLLTEGRLEQSIMPIYNAVVQARVKASVEVERKADAMRRKVAEAKNVA